MTFPEYFTFLRAWLASPRRTGAIAPSSDALARLITADITAAHAPVIELGAGTGVFTRQLARRGVPESRIAIIESGPAFHPALKANHPVALVLTIDAARLSSVDLFGRHQAGAVISGLPLLSFPLRTNHKILKGAFLHLREDGAFYQFTYGPHCPIQRAILDRLGLQAQRLGTCLSNLPPATVYRISRRRTAADAPPGEEPAQHRFASDATRCAAFRCAPERAAHADGTGHRPPVRSPARSRGAIPQVCP